MKLIRPKSKLASNTLCFTTSTEGGNSKGPYASLNLAMHVGDNKQDVQANRHLLSQYIEDARKQLLSNAGYLKNPRSRQEKAQEGVASTSAYIPYLNQIHSTKVLTLEEYEQSNTPCDGIFSTRTGQALAILTADCLPIVLVSKATNEFAVVHAGWRGLHDGILDNAIQKFSCSGKNVYAWIGPAICQNHFEVGEDVASKFAKFASQVRVGKRDKFHVNLAGIAELELNRLGIKGVQQSGVCTYCQDDLFSYRRSSHKNFADCGRMATIVIRY